MVNLVETVLIIRIIDTFKVATFVIAVNPNEEADIVQIAIKFFTSQCPCF